MTASTVPDDPVLKDWTGRKLDWCNGVSIDPNIQPYQFEVAFAIIQHANFKTKVAILSDEAIEDATNISRSQIWRARRDLRKAGWLQWRRTRTANIYEPLFGNVDRCVVLRVFRSECRAERRRRRPPAARDLSPRNISGQQMHHRRHIQMRRGRHIKMCRPR